MLTGLIALPAADPVRRRLDSVHVAAAGHSAGAITALGVLTEEGGRDRRFTAAVILAGNLLGVGDTFADPPVPVLFVHAAGDPIVPYATGKAAYDGLPASWPRAMLTLPGAGHSGPYMNARDPRSPAVRRRLTTDFLRGSLYGDQAALRRLGRMAHLSKSANL